MHPRVGSDCIAADYVSSHYDVHICTRTGGHAITTPRAADVCGKIPLTILRKGCCQQHPDEASKSLHSGPKFPSSSVSHHVLRSCIVIPSFSNVNVELPLRVGPCRMVCCGQGVRLRHARLLKCYFRALPSGEVLHLPQKFTVSPSLSVCRRVKKKGWKILAS